MLRDYQRKTIEDLYSWFDRHDSGHPCLVLPTGAGKSHIVAALCKEALQSWPETRVLMVTHQKELIEQNAAKLRQHWPNAPMGIYSASVGKRTAKESGTWRCERHESEPIPVEFQRVGCDEWEVHDDVKEGT